ncbi:MAG TPA: ABC transporter permease [Deltaproteobacteria bacterium]|nr:ABC transporter permease [Deltaproteobacteria bacterium]
MSATLTVASKELRALFKSAIALLFLEAFLVVTLFVFFSTGKFFARNLADIRPMFEWLPLLLIALVSATTMRAWAEERRAGTLEVLLTLPVRTVDLVLGKFLAGMGLVLLALAFTLPLPLTVWSLGPLDWGPVVGGYFAATLLASTYMAIGLCVSSRTDNQVVALMVTVLLGGLIYVIGSDGVADFFSAGTAEVLRSLGTGSRFESIERGVLDLRDIVYYSSLTVLFLVLNGVFLDRERLDPGSKSGSARNQALIGLVALVGLNVVALNIWLAPIHRARVDLTANNDYTVSETTAKVLSSLDEPLTIRALVSERTHPALAPLIPQIRDTLEEYEIYGQGRVHVSMEDPNSDEELEAEINEQYSIRPIPFGVSDRHSQAVVNAYFHLVLAYGDQFEVLSIQDLVEVRMDPAEGLQVKLRNLEYDLTRTLRKVTQEFQTLESLISKLPEPAKLTAYVTPALLPEDFAGSSELLDKVGKDLAAIDPDQLTFSSVDPSTDQALQQRLLDEYGIQPLAADLFGQQRFYLHLLIEVGDHAEAILPRGDLTEIELRSAVEAALRRAIPGQLKKVALFTAKPIHMPNPQLPPQAQPPPPQPDYQMLERLLSENLEVERTLLENGLVPQDVDVLVMGKTATMNAKQQFAVDQYLMRGGSVIALAGAYKIKIERQNMVAQAEDPPLFDLLSAWGVEVQPSIVMDPNNAPFPVPVQRRIAQGITIPSIELVPYPFFSEIRGAGLNDEHAALSGVGALVMPWSSPLTTPETLEGREIDWLIRSSPESWLRPGGNIEPDRVDGGPIWDEGGDKAQQTLGVAITGRFPSYFADLPNPLSEEGEEAPEPLKASVADGRLVVLGSSELTSDLMMQLASQASSESHSGNIQLLQNLIDWSVEDTDLLKIRTAGAFARTLRPLSDDEAKMIEIRTWLIMIVFSALFVLLAPRMLWRRADLSFTEQPK